MPIIYGSSEIWGDLLVTGSFSILGSASIINTTNLLVSDTIISLGHSQSGSPILDEGIMFGRGTGLTQAFIWDESDDTFALVETNDDHTVIGDIGITGYSSLRVSGLTASQITITSGATSGAYLISDSNGLASWTSSSTPNSNAKSFGIVIDGGGSDITTGIKSDVVIPFNMTITSWTIVSSQTGSIVVDVWKSNYSSFPPTSSIAGTEKPTLSSQNKNQDLTLTTWTTTINAGDIIRFNVDSCTGIQKVTLSITGTL